MTRNIWLAIGAAVCLVFCLALFCGPVVDQSPSRRTITVLAAASLTDAMEEVGEAWTEESGNVVRINLGPSNALAQQILAGAPVDVFISANEKWADALAEKDRVEAQIPLLSNRLVWIVPKENRAGIANPSEIPAKAKRIALAGENVPAGMYADQALKATGLYDQLASRIVRGNDVRTTLTYVEQGEVDAGIVYATDAAITERVTTLGELDRASYDTVRYPALLLKGAAPPAANDFFAFLQSPRAREIFERHHFVVLSADSGEPE